MSKKVILATVLAGLASSAIAAEKGLTVTLSGSLDTQYGVRSEKNWNKSISGTAVVGAGNAKRATGALVNDTKLRVDAHGKAHGLTYGGHVTLNADTTESKFKTGTTNVAYETGVFVESFLGRMQAGSEAGAYNAMTVSAARVAKATGGASAGDAQYWTNFVRNDDFITSGAFYSDAAGNNQQQAAKFTYYTPSYMGFKAGVSFTPDMNQKGSVAGTHTVPGASGAVATGADSYGANGASGNAMLYRNIVSGGLSYAGKVSHVGVEAAVLAEAGKAKKDTDVSALKHKKLSSVEGGLKLSYNNFAVAGSVASLGRSGLLSTSLIKKSSYVTLGASYDYHNLGLSVTYLASKKGAKSYTVSSVAKYGHNKQKNVTFGADYKLAPGFMPYVEYTAFKQTYASTIAADLPKNNKGSVLLAGTKLQF
jgi:hypothetical protein